MSFDFKSLGSTPLNVSRRGFLGGTGALMLAVALPVKPSRAQDAAPMAAGTNVPAYLSINADGTVNFLSPFNEGGQGIHTGMAQIVGEELDIDPANFIIDNAPPGSDYMVMFGGTTRLTGGSFSMRSSYDIMRKLGASARQMILQAAAAKLEVAIEELTTEPGVVHHKASGKSVTYGEVADAAATLEIPLDVAVKDAKDFRWIGKSVQRLDAHAKSTGQIKYNIDQVVEGMLQAAVIHAPRRGMQPESIANEAEVKAMSGVFGVHMINGAVAVTADRWWRAKKAVDAVQVTWKEAAEAAPTVIDAAFSTAGLIEEMKTLEGPLLPGVQIGDAAGVIASASKTIEATYTAPFAAHAQLEPPAAVALFKEDGSLELTLPNQAPEQFLAAIAAYTGLPADKITMHTPFLGGFFGRHFLYGGAEIYPQAIDLAKQTGRPVKVIWSREQEFQQDAYRPAAVTKFRAALDDAGMPVAYEAVCVNEMLSQRSLETRDKANPNSIEGLNGKPYGIPNETVSQIYHHLRLPVGYWRSVGHSINDFFSESFFDEMALAGGNDPFELRKKLVANSPRHAALIAKVEEISGGWKAGTYQAEDGTTRARGVALASPFGSEVATIAEVSITDGQIRCHNLWMAFDAGHYVNPTLVEHQLRSGAILGLSSALYEEVVYENGEAVKRNYDTYPIVKRDEAPEITIALLESDAPMGGVGEPGVPSIAPAVANAVAVLTGKRLQSLPFKNTDLS